MATETKKSGFPWRIVILVGIGLALFCCWGSVSFSQLYTSDPGRQAAATARAMPAPSPSSFVIVSSKSEWKAAGLHAIGEVKNVGAVAAGVEIELIARDVKGVLVDSVKRWPSTMDNIPAGGTTGFDYLITTNPAAVAFEVKVISARVW